MTFNTIPDTMGRTMKTVAEKTINAGDEVFFYSAPCRKAYTVSRNDLRTKKPLCLRIAAIRNPARDVLPQVVIKKSYEKLRESPHPPVICEKHTGIPIKADLREPLRHTH